MPAQLICLTNRCFRDSFITSRWKTDLSSGDCLVRHRINLPAATYLNSGINSGVLRGVVVADLTEILASLLMEKLDSVKWRLSGVYHDTPIPVVGIICNDAFV